MKILIVAAKNDCAAMNMYEHLLKNFEFKETEKKFDGNAIHEIKHNTHEFSLVKMNDILYNKPEHKQWFKEMFLDTDLIVDCVWHEGKSGPLLSSHVAGNPTTESILGAPPKSFALVRPNAIRSALQEYAVQKKKLNLEQFTVCQETTHGVPVDLHAPMMDLEIGTTEEDHKNRTAGEAASYAVMAVANYVGKEVPVAIGFGDLHYAEKFTKIVLNGNMAFGHIIPSHSVKYFDQDELKLIIDKTVEPVKYLVYNKKEESEHKQKAKDAASVFGLEVLAHKEALQV